MEWDLHSCYSTTEAEGAVASAPTIALLHPLKFKDY